MAQPMKAAQGRPPDKGSFPLDHSSECKASMEDYMRCLKANSNESFRCREQSAAYLSCRMDRNLMARESLVGLGYRQMDTAPSPALAAEPARTESQRGFVAGLNRVNAVRAQEQEKRR
ncbi:hypothetical protein T492DRAFT_945410 [Pavlovales sp. CCMP2436]|nr:hypothetical protein T492DRAFT_945410 [Pavlovales sp. CCMP2436]